jgi:HEAT repeat protein
MGLFDRFKKKDAPARSDTELEALIGQLRSLEWQSRHAAATRLGELGARALPAVPFLEELISDDNGEVCLAASDAMSKIQRAAQS